MLFMPKMCLKKSRLVLSRARRETTPAVQEAGKQNRSGAQEKKREKLDEKENRFCNTKKNMIVY